MEYVVCNLCGSTDAAPLIRDLPDFLLQHKDVSATFVKCLTCGLIYQNPRPTFVEMAAHYPPAYESYALEPSQKNSSWLLGQAIRYGIGKRCRYVNRYKRSGRLLDIGCATGVFLRGMQATGEWKLYGVEINEYAARIAQEHGFTIHVGTLKEAAFPNEFFDAITLWDVLEHLHDPSESLREAHRILKPDGIVVIRVPSASSWDAALFGRYWAGLDAPRHLYVFTPQTLQALLVANCFRAISWSSQMGAYTTFLLSLRFWNSTQSKPNAARDSLVKLLHHPVMRLLAAPVFYLMGIGLRGPLMVVTAIKCVEVQ